MNEIKKIETANPAGMKDERVPYLYISIKFDLNIQLQFKMYGQYYLLQLSRVMVNISSDII